MLQAHAVRLFEGLELASMYDEGLQSNAAHVVVENSAQEISRDPDCISISKNSARTIPAILTTAAVLIAAV